MSAGSDTAGNCRKTAGFYPDFPELVPAIPATKSCDQGCLIFELDFGRISRGDSGHFRVGVLSRDLQFFRRCDIALDTRALPARVAARGHCS
ncbi:unnamed protein product [Prunus armeniaca]